MGGWVRVWVRVWVRGWVRIWLGDGLGLCLAGSLAIWQIPARKGGFEIARMTFENISRSMSSNKKLKIVLESSRGDLFKNAIKL